MSPTLEELSEVLALIHEAAVSPERWTQALSALTRICESSKGAVLDIDPAGRLAGIAQIGHDPAAQSEYAQHYYALDPTMEAALAGPPHEGLVTYEHFSPAERARSEYFTYMARYDVGDVIGMGTRNGPAGRSILSLQRPLRAPGFDDGTKRLFRLIAPHLEVAKQVQARVAEAIAARDSLAAGLDRLADAAFIIDAAQTIRHLNATAQRLLAIDARLCSKGGKLSFAAVRLQSAFRAAVQAATAKAAHSQLLALPPANGIESAEITVCPLRDAHPLASSWQQPLSLVMVSLPRRNAAAIAARMRQLYHLTPAEARVVALLALGRSVEEISQATGVRESTLRSHLKSVRAKTGVSRQAELVRLALGGTPLV